MVYPKRSARALALSACLLACGQDTTAFRGTGGPQASTEPDDDVVPGERAFSDAQILTVRLTMPAEQFTELEEHGNREQYVPTSARVEGSGFAAVEISEIGVRHKGSYTLHHCWDEFGGVRSYLAECQKLSFKLKFDFADPNLRFDGLKRLNLHASSGDASKLRELMAYQLYRDFGVDAPRAVPARLYVNGAFQGLFIAVEDVDGRYARAHYPDGPNGNLYKEIWPSPYAVDADFSAALETNEGASVSDFRAFADAVERSTAATFDAEVTPFVDLEALLRYVAVDRALRNWDGIMAFYAPVTPHNFFWYHDDGPEPRFHLIPWDLDNTFWAFDPYMHPEQWVTAEPVPDFNATPLDCNARPVWDRAGPESITPPRCDRFLDFLALNHWQRLVELGGELLAGPFTAPQLRALADRWEPIIAPIVAEDPTLDPASWRAAVNELHQILEEAGAGFQSFLDEGLIAEVREALPEQLSPAELAVATADTGLHVDLPTNFEFMTPPLEGVPANVFTYADPLATFSATWSTDNPIAGNADLRFDFTFNRAPGLYDEWAGIIIERPAVDVSDRSTLVVWLSSDIPRTVRVRLSSPAYEDTFGGIFNEFGSDQSVGPEPRAVIIDLREFHYPDWAKAEWNARQGFRSDADGLAEVLRRFNGLIFSPAATVDPAGQLRDETETGYMRIDNIYFL